MGWRANAKNPGAITRKQNETQIAGPGNAPRTIAISEKLEAREQWDGSCQLILKSVSSSRSTLHRSRSPSINWQSQA